MSLETKYDFPSFQQEFIKTVKSGGGNINIDDDGRFTITVPVIHNEKEIQINWERGTVKEKYRDFLNFAESVEEELQR